MPRVESGSLNINLPKIITQGSSPRLNSAQCTQYPKDERAFFPLFRLITQYAIIILILPQKIRREQREQQEKELLEKRQQFKEATKNLLVFAPEEQAPKEKSAKGRKVTLCLSCSNLFFTCTVRLSFSQLLKIFWNAVSRLVFLNFSGMEH